MRRRWEVHKVAIGHRVGTVGVGELSVIIAVSSAHRRASLEVTGGEGLRCICLRWWNSKF